MQMKIIVLLIGAIESRYNSYTLKSMNREEIKNLIRISKHPFKIIQEDSIRTSKSIDIVSNKTINSKL